jgi:hypothetical protein
MLDYFALGYWQEAYFGGEYFGPTQGGGSVYASATIHAAGTLTATATTTQRVTEQPSGGGRNYSNINWTKPPRRKVYVNASADLIGGATLTAQARADVSLSATIQAGATVAAQALATERDFTAFDNEFWLLAA